MKGEQEYKNQYESKIKRILKDNKDKDYIEGFYYYTCSSNLNGLSSSYNYLLSVLRFLSNRGKDIDKLNLDDYTIYMNMIQDKSSSYKITTYSALKKFSEYLYATKRNELNPMQYISRPKKKESIETKEKRDKGYLTKNEIKKYINTVNNGSGSSRAKARQEQWKERDLAIITLLLDTGLRCSGLYKLDLSSIDLENHILITVEKGGKIKKEKISENVIHVLFNWIVKREMILDGKEEDALFISNRKERLTQKGISDVVKKYAKQFDNKNITPHKLRATYATSLYNASKDIKFVKRKMGHSNISTTELYIRGQEEEYDPSAEIMGNIIPV